MDKGVTVGLIIGFSVFGPRALGEWFDIAWLAMGACFFVFLIAFHFWGDKGEF